MKGVFSRWHVLQMSKLPHSRQEYLREWMGALQHSQMVWCGWCCATAGSSSRGTMRSNGVVSSVISIGGALPCGGEAPCLPIGTAFIVRRRFSPEGPACSASPPFLALDAEGDWCPALCGEAPCMDDDAEEWFDDNDDEDDDDEEDDEEDDEDDDKVEFKEGGTSEVSDLDAMDCSCCWCCNCCF